jgi:hypothetical protein
MYQMLAYPELTDSFKRILTNTTTYMDTPNCMRILYKIPWEINVSLFEVYKFLLQSHFIDPTSQVCNYAEYMSKQYLIHYVTLHDQNYCVKHTAL